MKKTDLKGLEILAGIVKDIKEIKKISAPVYGEIVGKHADLIYSDFPKEKVIKPYYGLFRQLKIVDSVLNKALDECIKKHKSNISIEKQKASRVFILKNLANESCLTYSESKLILENIPFRHYSESIIIIKKLSGAGIGFHRIKHIIEKAFL